MQWQEVGPGTWCNDVTSGWSAPVAIASSLSTQLSQGSGNKKICVKYTCSGNGATAQCGGMIELRKRCRISPANTTTSVVAPNPATYTLYSLSHQPYAENSSIWLARPDHGQIVPLPSGSTEFFCPAAYCGSDQYYYRFGQVASTNSTETSATFNTPTNLASGDYYVHCDMEFPSDTGFNCSGNPICSYETDPYGLFPAGGTDDCGPLGFESCGDTDNTLLVVASPSPTPTAAARARARLLADTPSVCSNIYNDTTDYQATTFTLTGESNQSSDGSGGYALWRPLGLTAPFPNSKSIGIPNLTDYTTHSCRQDEVAGTWTMSALSWNFDPGERVRWEVGYAPPGPWFTTRGGDVYGAGGITSQLPESLATRYFNYNGHSPGSVDDSGLVIHGGSSTYDFSLEAGDGRALVSARSWLANENPAMTNTDLYQYLWLRLGAPVTATTGVTLSGNFDCGATDICYFTSDQSTAGAISLAANSRQIVIIDGDLNINYTIDTGSNGFIAFIVSGDITVASNVGNATPIDSDDSRATINSNDNLDGIYVAGGIFTVDGDGTSDLQLVVQGSVIANSFVFPRDFRPDRAAYVTTSPTELFVYNPQYLFTMPLIMQDIPVKWEEVAPAQ